MRKLGIRGGEWGVTGFSLIELLIAMTITLLIAGALAAVAQPARAAFDRVPAELELQQRGRAAVEALSQALRASLSGADADGLFDELTVVVPVPAPAQGLLLVDQPGPSGAITLGTEHCPNVKEVCGFATSAAALIKDSSGNRDIFSIASVDASARHVTPATALSRAYSAGSAVLEVDQFTFRLSEQADGSYSLIRETFAGAIQPIVDFVSDLSFEVIGSDVDISITLEPAAESARPLTVGRTFRSSIKVRNAS